MKTFKFLSRCLVFFIFSSLFSCGAIVKSKTNKYATVQKGAIPNDFGKEDMTMLFITKSKRSYDKYLKRNIRKVYHGDYKLIHHSELSDPEYKDLAKYPYYFDYSYETYTYFSNNETIHGPGGGNATGNVRRFSIIDRKDEKAYQLKLTSGFWSKLQRVYIKNIEAQRLKNLGLN